MKTTSIFKYAFTIIGLGLLYGAYILFSDTQVFLKTAVSTNGTVVDLIRSESSDSVTYSPIVNFHDKNGQLTEITSSSSSNPPSYFKGEIVEVLYQESFPEDAKINDFFALWGGATILGAIGAVFFLIGFSIIMYASMKGKKIKYLKTHGVSIKATIQGVEYNSSLVVNGRSPYKILAQWKNPTTNDLHIFSSENIWFDPSDHINNKELTVLMARNNPKKYHVDTSFLPKIAS
jgi:hypothetical protein